MAEARSPKDAPRGGPPGRPATPRWVKVFGIIALVLVVLVLLMLLIGGKHGPGRHLGGGGPAIVAELAHEPRAQL